MEYKLDRKERLERMNTVDTQQYEYSFCLLSMKK